MRIGHGYDAHRFCEHRALIVGGVSIPYERGLAGHSDADVLTHALIDALLGAMTLGDIGAWFPPSDARYREASSLGLLQEVAGRMKREGYRVCNIDATIVAEEPRMGPHMKEMRQNFEAILGPCPINIKATTEETMGFTGQKEGMCAHVVCLLAKGNGG